MMPRSKALYELGFWKWIAFLYFHPMTLYEFNALSPKEKEIATVNGKFIAERNEAAQTAALYSVGNFWVEIWYDNALNEVLFLNGFRSTERLVPYLSGIDLTLQTGDGPAQ